MAQEEHDAFAKILRDEGVEVVYLEDLMAEVLDAHPELREKFLDQWIFEAGIRTDTYKEIIKDYINSNYAGTKDMVMKTMAASTCRSCPRRTPIFWSIWSLIARNWSAPRCRTCTSPATRSR